VTARRLDVLPGSAFPLGASVDADGVNFAVFSESGTRAFVCLFDPADPTREIARHELWERTAHVFHGYLPRVRPGAMYGFRVEGPYRPEEGHRFNASKLLVDPYARALHGEVDWKAPTFGYAVDGPAEDRDLVSDPRDDAPGVPKAIVVHQGFDWGGDSVRRFWRGDENQVAEMGYRLTGSSDLFQGGGRRPHASINYVTTHDGFTLADLVTYANKHNEANGEANRDGPNDNYSWNYGVEGPCEHPAIVRLRERQKRNLMATLLLSQGVPMILAGDEMGRTQGGNNNAYCQDNEISWLDWHLDEHQQAFLRFTSMMIEVRKRHGVLRHDRFFRGDRIWDSRLKDLAWFRPDGSEMSAEDWQRPFGRTLAFLLGGDALTVPDQYGRVASGDTLLVLLNAHHEPVEFVLPKLEWGADWGKIVDTSEELGQPEPVHVAALGRLVVDGRSLVVLCQRVNESKDEEVAAIGASP
jgi:pullulanase/glycogen debranching enzyme